MLSMSLIQKIKAMGEVKGTSKQDHASHLLVNSLLRKPCIPFQDHHKNTRVLMKSVLLLYTFFKGDVFCSVTNFILKSFTRVAITDVIWSSSKRQTACHYLLFTTCLL